MNMLKRLDYTYSFRDIFLEPRYYFCRLELKSFENNPQRGCKKNNAHLQQARKQVVCLYFAWQIEKPVIQRPRQKSKV